MAKKSKPIKIRKSWGTVKPVTKIKDSDKIYKRKRITAKELHDWYGVD